MQAKNILGYSSGVALLCMAAGLVPAAAQTMESGGIPAHTYIAVRSKATPPPPVTPANLQMKEAGKLAQVTGLSQALQGGKGIELAFVLDDSLRGNVGNQLEDIKSFFNALPPGVDVFVGYMENGRVAPATPGFTAQHEVAAKALRLPRGIPGGNASPYFCLSDLVKHWPAPPTGRARVVFMVTNGVDNYSGVSPLNQDSPYVDAAIKDAQKAGVLVYSLYYADTGVGGRLADYSGQSYLNKTSQETGGVAYYQGTFNPVSFAPFLGQFQDELERLFDLKFLAPVTGLQPIKLNTNIKGVKLGAPEQVYVSAPE